VPKFLRWALIVVLLVLVTLFALANYQPVEIRFDPLDTGPAALRVPFFIAAFAFLLIGVVIGGAAAWLRQAKWRRRARERGRTADGLSRELSELRAERAVAVPAPVPARVGDDLPRTLDPHI
jgi:uncharacterized integral membrane protein